MRFQTFRTSRLWKPSSFCQSWRLTKWVKFAFLDLQTSFHQVGGLQNEKSLPFWEFLNLKAFKSMSWSTFLPSERLQKEQRLPFWAFRATRLLKAHTLVNLLMCEFLFLWFPSTDLKKKSKKKMEWFQHKIRNFFWRNRRNDVLMGKRQKKSGKSIWEWRKGGILGKKGCGKSQNVTCRCVFETKKQNQYSVFS